MPFQGRSLLKIGFVWNKKVPQTLWSRLMDVNCGYPMELSCYKSLVFQIHIQIFHILGVNPAFPNKNPDGILQVCDFETELHGRQACTERGDQQVTPPRLRLDRMIQLKFKGTNPTQAANKEWNLIQKGTKSTDAACFRTFQCIGQLWIYMNPLRFIQKKPARRRQGGFCSGKARLPCPF